MTKHIGSIWTLHCGTPLELLWISNVTESRSCGVEGANVEFLLQHQNKCRLSITRGHCDRKLIAFISCLCGLWLRLFDANPCLESSCKPTSRNIEKQRQKTAADLHDSQYHHSRCVQDTVEARKCAVLSFKYLSKINSCCCLLFRLLLWKALWRNRVCWNEWGEP